MVQANPLHRPSMHRQSIQIQNDTSPYPVRASSFSSTTSLPPHLPPVDNPFTSILPGAPDTPITPINMIRLWSEVEKINQKLPTPFQIERDEFERQISNLSRRYDDISRPELVSKSISGSKHSYVIGNDEHGEIFILIKPNMTNARYQSLTDKQRHTPEAKAVMASGATKVVKKGAILIQFSGQNAVVEEYLTYSCDTDGNKDATLKEIHGYEAIRDGWKEFRFFDPQKNLERTIYLIPNFGNEILHVFPSLTPDEQKRILFELVLKTKEEKPFDLKSNNIMLDNHNVIHLIDDKDQTFRYTPHLHFRKGCDYDVSSTGEKTIEAARILCLTYTIWLLINKKACIEKSSFNLEIFELVDGMRDHNHALTEVVNRFHRARDEGGFVFTDTLQKAYLSCLSYDQLEHALHALFGETTAQQTSDAAPARTGIKRWICC